MDETTIIGVETQVSGTVAGEGSVEVRGRLHGTVELTEHLTVADSGHVDAESTVEEATIHGHYTGALTARTRIILTATARVDATLTTPVLVVEDGAQLRGHIEMEIDGEAPVAPARRPATTSTPSSRPAPVRQTSRPVTTATRPVTTPKPSTTTTTTTASRPTTSFAPRRPTPSSPVAATPAPRTSVVTVTEEEVEVATPTPAPTPVPVAQPEPPAPVATPEPPAPEPTPEPVVEEEPAPAPVAADTSAFDEYTVKELREELRRLDLPVSGSKSELKGRLASAQGSNS